MKKKLFFFVLILPLFIYSQEYTTYRSNIYDPDGVEGDFFGTKAAVSADGNTILVASTGYAGGSGTDTNTGKVSVYQYITDSWVKIGSDITGYQAGDYFGSSLDINATGDIIAIGSTYGTINGSNSGYVRVFQNISGTWTQLGSDFVGQSANQSLGSDISLNADGTRIAIGISGANTTAGEVKVYQYNTSNWTQLGSTLNGVVANDRFGTSLDFDDTGSYLAIGAPFVDSNGTPDGQDRGQVKVYEYTTDWNQIFTASGSMANDLLGSKVELSGNNGVLAVTNLQGTNYDPSNGAGYVRTYYWNGSGYTYFRDTFGLSANDRFGRSLALSNDGLFMAVSASSINSSSPKVYLYKRGQASGVTNWDLQPGEYDDSDAAGSGASLGLNSGGNILFTSAYVPDPNGVNGVIKTYADHSTLSIENNALENLLTVYPNPITNVLFINNLSGLEIQSVSVFDISGRLCVEKSLDTLGKIRIDMNHLSSGSYLVKVQVENATKTFKVLKN